MEQKHKSATLSYNCRREEWVDVLRGVAVFMVILGHLYKDYPYHLIVNPVKMPAFYFIAGYVTSVNKPIRGIIISRAIGLFIPMIVFSLFPIRFLYYLIILKDYALTWTYVMGVIDGSINWFIYSFFVSSILFACLVKLVKGNHLSLGIICFMCFVVGFLTRDNSFMQIWSLNTALTSVLFMFMGYELRNHQLKILNSGWMAIICLVLYCLLLWVSFTLHNGEVINYHLCFYYSLPICLGLIISGLVFLRYSLIRMSTNWKSKIKQFFVSFGQNTIVVYLASSTFNAITISSFKRFLGTGSPNFIFCFVGAIASCLMGYIVSIFCRKHIPILFGIWKKS